MRESVRTFSWVIVSLALSHPTAASHTALALVLLGAAEPECFDSSPVKAVLIVAVRPIGTIWALRLDGLVPGQLLPPFPFSTVEFAVRANGVHAIKL